ncbi:hypothetical protein BTJ68_11661 [Hortaea werneckii EXF-2000]|uniref:Uncharacterized protein n=1 Tax=Hortaea werneckii EXF-2000 TaxID=1157616 RepID=A0A1Z5STV1_HORWE|nr:hypothetical protein BTJ68_11661 [Hortaea werneckii EXF-2000]
MSSTASCSCLTSASRSTKDTARCRRCFALVSWSTPKLVPSTSARTRSKLQ